MRLFALTLATLIAFAANSILNRAALAGTGMDPGIFTGIRLLSGAAMLGVLVAIRTGSVPRAGSWPMAGALVVYALGFSYAYLTLDAGVGALILFGVVQMTMFAGGMLAGERPGLHRWVGSAMGLAGLGILYLPGATAPDPLGGLLMAVAAVGWGIYSLLGRKAGPPLITTAGNFIRTVPVAFLVLVISHNGGAPMAGIVLAIASGALASGLGYAIWYAVLPELDASTAAVAQLTVPLIALAGGVAFLGETTGWGFAISAGLVLGGVAVSVLYPQPRPSQTPK